MYNVTRNQLENLDNRYQDFKNHKRVLCVCSAGMLRSASMSVVLASEYGYNTRSAGTEDYALVPVTEALLIWADEIVCAEERHKERILSEIIYDSEEEYIVLIESKFYKNVLNKITVLNIPDNFSYMDPKLVELIKERYSDTLK